MPLTNSQSTNLQKQPEQSAPILIYDGDCNFCKMWICILQEWNNNTLKFSPYSEFQKQHPHFQNQNLHQAVQLFQEDHIIAHGANAIFKALSLATKPLIRKYGILLEKAYARFSLFQKCADFTYNLVARHRSFCWPIAFWIWGEHIQNPACSLSSSSKKFSPWYTITRIAFAPIVFLAFIMIGTKSLQSILIHNHAFLLSWIQFLGATYGIGLSCLYLFRKIFFDEYIIKTLLLSLLVTTLNLFL